MVCDFIRTYTFKTATRNKWSVQVGLGAGTVDSGKRRNKLRFKGVFIFAVNLYTYDVARVPHDVVRHRLLVGHPHVHISVGQECASRSEARKHRCAPLDSLLAPKKWIMAGVSFAVGLSLTSLRTLLVVDHVSSSNIVSRATQAVSSIGPNGAQRSQVPSAITSPRQQAAASAGASRVRSVDVFIQTPVNP